MEKKILKWNKNQKSVRLFDNVELLGFICIPKPNTVIQDRTLPSKLINILTKITISNKKEGKWLFFHGRKHI